MAKERLTSPKAGMVCLALVKTDLEDGSSEDVFLRARVEEVTENQVSVLCVVCSRLY